MPKVFSEKVETQVTTLSKVGWSYEKIKSEVEKDGIDISTKTIGRIINSVGITRQAALAGQEKPKNQYPCTKRTPAMVKKIGSMVKGENPATQRAIASETGLSLATVNKVIHQDLGLDKRKKYKVHRLTPLSRQNRKTNCRFIYENHLAGDRSEYAVTLDEALIYMKNVNGKRKICYVKQGEKVPHNWVFERDKSYSKGFMVIGILTGRGTVPLFRVPTACKINAEYYVEYVLKPLFHEYLPALYENEMDKVFFHHDKASSHTAELTTEFLETMKEQLGILYLEKRRIPVKSSDASPLDFFGFGYLKQKLFLRKARTLEGVWKIAQGMVGHNCGSNQKSA